MPNGGEDCCGTCSHNAKNRGVAGYPDADDGEPDFCKIRQLPIVFPFYTYCANHPFRNVEQIEIPIGPVFSGESLPPRWIWKDSPDSETIRQTLLELLAEIPATPPEEYPAGISRWESVIWQLGEFRERRAVPDLKRLAGPPLRGLRWVFGRHARSAVAVHALEALHKIEQHSGGDSCPVAGRFVRGRPAELVKADREEKAHVVRVAQAVLDGKVGVIEGSRGLSEVVGLLSASDKSLVSIFGQVVTASLSFPEGPVRAKWNPEALKEKDLERTRFEDEVADSVKDACRVVVRLLEAPSS